MGEIGEKVVSNTALRGVLGKVYDGIKEGQCKIIRSMFSQDGLREIELLSGIMQLLDVIMEIIPEKFCVFGDTGFGINSQCVKWWEFKAAISKYWVNIEVMIDKKGYINVTSNDLQYIYPQIWGKIPSITSPPIGIGKLVLLPVNTDCNVFVQKISVQMFQS